VIAYAIVDLRSSLDNPLGDALKTLVGREDAERFVNEVRGDEPELASCLRIEERELEAGLVDQCAAHSRDRKSRLDSIANSIELCRGFTWLR
jgi:hypothetical protein